MNKKQIIELLENKYVNAMKKLDGYDLLYKGQIKEKQKAFAENDYQTEKVCDYEISRLDTQRTTYATVADEIAMTLAEITDKCYDDEYEYLTKKYKLY